MGDAETDLNDVPFCVEPGFTRSDVITNLGGRGYALLRWPDGSVGFEHRCDRGARGVIHCAPRLQTGHQITTVIGEDGQTRPSVTPSILCPDCGTRVHHGREVA